MFCAYVHIVFFWKFFFKKIIIISNSLYDFQVRPWMSSEKNREKNWQSGSNEYKRSSSNSSSSLPFTPFIPKPNPIPMASLPSFQISLSSSAMASQRSPASSMDAPFTPSPSSSTLFISVSSTTTPSSTCTSVLANPTLPSNCSTECL